MTPTKPQSAEKSAESTRVFMKQLDVWTAKQPINIRVRTNKLHARFLQRKITGDTFKAEIKKIFSDAKLCEPTVRTRVETPPLLPPSVREKRQRPRVETPAKKRHAVRPHTPRDCRSEDLDRSIEATVSVVFSGRLVDRIAALERRVQFLEQESASTEK